MTKIELKIDSDDCITNANIILMYKDGGMQVKTVDIVNNPSTQNTQQVTNSTQSSVNKQNVRPAISIGEDDAFKMVY